MLKTIVNFLLFVSISSSSAQDDIAFPDTYTFEEIKKLQQNDERPIVVFIHTDWCKFCFAMKKNTFTSKNIIEKLNTSFYFIMLDAEYKKDIIFYDQTFRYKPTGLNTGIHELAETLGDKNGQINYPLTAILNPNRNIDAQFDTFLAKEELLKILSEYEKLNTKN
ncbi:MAG: thioredoxin-related protein [Urechidicola sp.]|jgi:thioredoxin-related protein